MDRAAAVRRSFSPGKRLVISPMAPMHWHRTTFGLRQPFAFSRAEVMITRFFLRLSMRSALEPACISPLITSPAAVLPFQTYVVAKINRPL